MQKMASLLADMRYKQAGAQRYRSKADDYRHLELIRPREHNG